MKLPTIHIQWSRLSPAARTRLTRFYATFSAVMYKIIPVVVLALVFAQIAVLLDQAHYRKAPATDFLQYTDFTVQNARVGEDVYFKVCRQHLSPIRYTGDLSIYIFANPGQQNEKRIKTYGRTLNGSIDNDCENKVIRATDFKHPAGTYEMAFCVDFKVKYGYQKRLCKTSNRYRIYPQPADLESQIMSLEQQLQAARVQLNGGQGGSGQPTNQSQTTPQTQIPGATNKSTAGNTSATNGGGQSGTGVQPPTCAVNLGGIGLACGSSGILRL